MIRIALPAFVLVTGALALACTAATPPAAPSTGEVQDQPKQGGSLKTTHLRDPFDYDPTFRGRSNPNEYALSMMFNSLLGFRNGPDVPYSEMILRPELAERWEVSPDAKTFTFHLRKGVKFHSAPPLNGRELTSADVKWTYEYASRTGEFKDKRDLPRSTNQHLFEGMEGIDTPDTYTARVRFKDPYVPFVGYTASWLNPIVAKEVYQQDGHLKDTPAGTGPFRVDPAAGQKGTVAVFKKNPTYWEEGKPYLDEIRWLLLASEPTWNAAFQTKQIDVIREAEFRSFQEVKRQNPNISEHRYLFGRPYRVSLSLKQEPMKDVRVRKAIDLAIDREEANRTIWGGQAGWAMPGVLYGTFTDEEIKTYIKHDPEEAKRLMAQAGYAAGLNFDFPIPDDLETAANTYLQLLQAQLKRINVNFTLKPMPQNQQRELRYAGEFWLDLGMGQGTWEADIDSVLFGTYRSTGSGNYGALNDPELDRLLDQQRRETDPQKRRELIRTISKRLAEQHLTFDVMHQPNWDFTHTYVKGYYPHLGDRVPYQYAWLDK